MKRARALIIVGLMISGISATGLARAEDDYPPIPDSKLTPGSLCTNPTYYRYGERVPYCERSVKGTTKQYVFDLYVEIGFKISPNDRYKYKIDHLIPLCAGGSNEIDNLWPEHVSIYTIVDPLEPAICDKMSMGRLKQREAVDLVLRAKQFPEEAEKVIDYVFSL